MQDLTKFYRALREYREKLSDDGAHASLLRALEEDAAAQELWREGLGRCVWDEAWIDEIFRALPHVERAAEEQRRFIEARAEVRRVDQAKRATVDSVRHLAQHSNLISRVENGEVVPDRLLIVEREDNYAIYENRFLRTLAVAMRDFVGARIAVVEALAGAGGYSLRLDRSAAGAGGRLCAQLSLSAEMPGGAADGGAELPPMERVRQLEARIEALLAEPLMRELRGVPPVKPPIVRTNVLKKNEHFRRALELYEYLESYSRPGYELISDGEGARFSDALRADLNEAVAMAGFAAHLAATDGLREALEENYQQENARAEAERIRREEERERAILERIQRAREEEIRIREAEVARRDAEIARRREEIRALGAQLDEERSRAQAREVALRREAEDERARSAAALADERRRGQDALAAAQRRSRAQMDALEAEGRAALERERAGGAQALETAARAHEAAQAQAARQAQEQLEALRAQMQMESASALREQARAFAGREAKARRALEKMAARLERSEARVERLRARVARKPFWRGKSER